MKTYTFKIKVDTDKVVIAVNMQLEQFYDSVKMTTGLNGLVERYPEAYITACDYYGDYNFISQDFCLCKLKTLLNSHDLKAFLTDKDFVGFVGDDSFNKELSNALKAQASEFIENEKNIVEDEEEKEDELSETDKE